VKPRGGAWAIAIALLLAGCIYVPRTTVVYDQECRIEAKHMTLEMTQVGALGSCGGNRCAELLVAAGAVAAASAVVSGSIVVTGNIVYWFEKQGRCLISPLGHGVQSRE
jgi:hypothetical protein